MEWNENHAAIFFFFFLSHLFTALPYRHRTISITTMTKPIHLNDAKEQATATTTSQASFYSIRFRGQRTLPKNFLLPFVFFLLRFHSHSSLFVNITSRQCSLKLHSQLFLWLSLNADWSRAWVDAGCTLIAKAKNSIRGSNQSKRKNKHTQKNNNKKRFHNTGSDFKPQNDAWMHGRYMLPLLLINHHQCWVNLWRQKNERRQGKRAVGWF